MTFIALMAALLPAALAAHENALAEISISFAHIFATSDFFFFWSHT